MQRSRALVGLTAAAAAAVLAVSPATATPTVSDPVASGLAGPLQFEVKGHGIYVTQNFAGLVTRINRDGTMTQLVSEPGEVSGVVVRGREVAYNFTGGTPEVPQAKLKLRKADGTVRTVARLARFEAKRNPDRRRTYGFLDLAPDCTEQIPEGFPGREPYKGIIESHPYALAAGPKGGWYVADAGSNAVLKVSRSGYVKVVYVAPAQEAVITAEAAEANGLPACTVGATYAFEGVPTDVERLPSGKLIVTLLPGGPEDPSLGARGSVVKVNPWTGRSWVLATGIAGATNAAVSPRGIYVTELFGGRISKVHHGRLVPVVDLPSPAAVEWAGGKLWASIDVFNEEAGGSIVKITR